MSDDIAAATKRRFSAGGCLLRVGIGMVALVALVVLIGTIFNEGDDADQPVDGFVAGRAESFLRGDVNYFEQEHIFLTRLPDGEFIALYDLSTRQRELGGTCRVRLDETAGVGTLTPLVGMAGAFVEDCNDVRGVWRLDGKFSFGPANTDLDRFNTRVDAQGTLIIDTDSRSCSRSRQVPGLPPFDSDTCGAPE